MARNMGGISDGVRAGISGAAALVILILGASAFDLPFFVALLFAVIVGIIVYFVLGLGDEDTSAPQATATSSETATASPEPAAAAAPEPKPSAPADPAPEAPKAEDTSAPGEAAAPASSEAPSESLLKPSAPLPGQAELAERKGSWRYEPEGTEATPSVESTPDYDGDGVLEGADEGTKPEFMTEAREGGPDNLKEIKGVGPKLEGLLHSMGVFHFDQVAAWTANEVAWVDANLEGFKGRVSRDDWVGQAKTLAAGGETEFSKKVGDGGVY